ncbi:MAG: 3'(2'),5'-bisphosphate nucleotidase CysQ [Hyphomonadaceae bacterium]|nr:3'(2'),5'-bisphosphate nucleotidase CysQ [Hyphomonadaceae bacterium]
MSLTSDRLCQIALAAGKVVMEIYDTDFDIERKDDSSPVTEADARAEALILEALAEADPDLPVIAEESVAEGHIPEHGHRFALVDPLDGTKEFINKRGEFTVNIAVIEYGRPIMGVVYAPALSRLFVAESQSHAWQAEVAPGALMPDPHQRKRMRIRSAPEAGVTAIASKSHRSPETDAFLEQFKTADIISAGSSLKFCLIAAGEADLYPRMGRTMEWDTAAGQAVAEASGARVLTEDNLPLLYGKRHRGYDNPYFIVYGDVPPPALKAAE